MPQITSSTSPGSSAGTLARSACDDVGAEVVGTTVDERALVGSSDRSAGGGDDDGFHGSPPGCSGQTLAVSVAGILLLSFVGGSVPFSNIAARFVSGVDLREIGGGTVSGTALYRVAGFWPLAVAGILDVTKGAVGPLLAGDRTAVAASPGALAVVGHNWSPFLRGRGRPRRRARTRRVARDRVARRGPAARRAAGRQDLPPAPASVASSPRSRSTPVLAIWGGEGERSRASASRCPCS